MAIARAACLKPVMTISYQIVLAIVWLLIAAGLFFWPVGNAAAQARLHVAGWLALGLAAFNILRWRMTAEQRRLHKEWQARRERTNNPPNA